MNNVTPAQRRQALLNMGRGISRAWGDLTRDLRNAGGYGTPSGQRAHRTLYYLTYAVDQVIVNGAVRDLSAQDWEVIKQGSTQAIGRELYGTALSELTSAMTGVALVRGVRRGSRGGRKPLPQGYRELRYGVGADIPSDDLPNGIRRITNDDGHIVFASRSNKVFNTIEEIPSHYWTNPRVDRFSEWRANQNYDDAAYHGNTNNPVKNARPSNPEEAFDNSYALGSNTERRIGVDKSTGEFVIFDNEGTPPNQWHGHARSWDELTQRMQSLLRREKIVTKRGRIR